MPEDMEELLKNAESYRKVMVEPVVAALKAEIQSTLKPIIDEQSTQKLRIGTVEGDVQTLRGLWSKALIGFTVWSTLFGLIVGICTAKIRKWIGF